METVTRKGFFTMDTVNAVCKAKTLSEAQQIARDAIGSYNGALPDSINKAMMMVDRSKSVQALAIAITNFLLAHPSENLKSIR